MPSTPPARERRGGGGGGGGGPGARSGGGGGGGPGMPPLGASNSNHVTYGREEHERCACCLTHTSYWHSRISHSARFVSCVGAVRPRACDGRTDFSCDVACRRRRKRERAARMEAMRRDAKGQWQSATCSDKPIAKPASVIFSGHG
eukprot:SAG25_NODE_1262_length_3466_cov_2.702703_7_plen_146_part_00